MTRSRAAIVVVLAATILSPVPTSAQIPPGARVVVLPFDNVNNEPRLVWMREGAAVLLTDLLASAGESTIPREERVRAFERLQLPAVVSLSRASSIRVGQAVGATVLVLGGIELSGEQLVARARLVRLDSGRLLPGVEARGPLADVFGVFGRLAEQLSAASPPPNATSRFPPSLRLFELYIKGLVAETPAAALAFLEQALKTAPAYDRVRMALWEIHTDADDHSRALAAVSPIGTGSPASREGRFRRALSLLALKRFEDSLQTLRTLQSEQPSASIANAIGVAELRKATVAQPGRATYYFSQATKLNPASGDLFFNLGYAYWREGDAKAAIYWLREAVRRQPGDGDAHYVLSVALQQSGAGAEGTRERELAARLNSKYARGAANPAGRDLVPAGLERLDRELTPLIAAVDSLIASAGLRDQDAQAAFHLDAGRRAYEREADREAIDSLRRALYLSPYLAEAHLLLGRLYLRGGRPESAVETLKIALWSEETVAAHIALAEAYLLVQDTISARTEVDRALALDPGSEGAMGLRVRIGGPPW